MFPETLSHTPAGVPFRSVNPATEEVIAEYAPLKGAELESVLSRATAANVEWRQVPLGRRAEMLGLLQKQLLNSKDSLARLITTEMGKPISQSRAEVEKCARLCEFYQAHGPGWLAPQEVTGNAAEQSWVQFDPLGGVLAVMPWNYPLWQVFRFAVPSLLAGNVGLLKHATNVLGCASAIEELFRTAGFPDGVFTSLNLHHSLLPGLIQHSLIKAVTLTGSEGAGIAVAEAAGRQLKKCVLELGGSDPFIVLSDADLPRTIAMAVESRVQNAGQSCIAAKRFIVHRPVYQQFVDGMVEALRAVRVGDPLEDETQMGPLARSDLRESLHEQVQATVRQGARLCTGGKPMDRRGWYYEPTLLCDVGPEMSAFQEETFGPLAAVTAVDSAEEAIALANQSDFGLGSSLWTEDLELAKQLATQLESGSVFINDYTKSDPSVPFGGVKRSGYGRELARFGLHEFVNTKTVWIARKD